MQTKIIEKYFFFGLLVATLLFTFFIFKPFWIVFVLGVSFAIVFYPIHKWFNLKLKLPNIFSALITVLLFVIILCGPVLGISALVFKQSQNVYNKVVTDGSVKPFMDKVEYKVNDVLPDIVTFDINQKTTDFVSYISKNIANIFSSTISAFFSFILMLLIMFYFLKEGEICKQMILKFSPLGAENDEKIISRLTQSINGVIKGSLLMALVQGTLLGTGFYIFGIPNGALWGVVAAVMSLIPTFGTALVSTPAIIFLFLTGNTAHAVGLLIWSALLVGTIDNILNPLVVGKKTNLPSVLILFSVLGGISFLGPVGILVGPITLSLLFALMSIYKNEFSKIN